jgi:exopolysaccharide biosynthesis polyprenyl glycosylphosphotransferase
VLSAFGGLSGALTAIAFSTIAVVLYHMAGGYDRIHTGFARSTLDEIPSIFVLAGLLTLLTIVRPTAVDFHLYGWHAAELWVALAAALAVGRVAARILAVRLIGAERCLVIGSLRETRRLRRRLRSGAANAEIIGALTPSQLDLCESVDELRQALAAVAADVHADRLIVAASGHEQEDIARLIQVAKLEGLELSVCSPLLDAAATNARMHHVSGLALLDADPSGSAKSLAWVTRGFDVTFSMAFLVLSSPLLAVIALAIKLDSPGPLFFRHVRVGRNGVKFDMLKFRSMVEDAESRKAALRHRSEVGAEMFKLSDDPRVTRVGHVLRRYSLDELPQLINVLRGEMTLVGPRPLIVEEDAIIRGVGRGRLQRTPGMTGPWQVSRERVAQSDMLEIDYSYVANWSLWVDLKILVRTVLHVIRSGNV